MLPVTPAYLDYNATTPLAESVTRKIHQSCQEHWANPSSSYSSGQKAKQAVREARKLVWQMVGAGEGEGEGEGRPDDDDDDDDDDDEAEREIVFTSGGTEANYLAFHSAIREFELLRQRLESSDSTSEVVDDAAHPPRAVLPHVVTSNVEHPATEKPLLAWRNQGRIELTMVAATPDGTVSVSSIMEAIRPNTCLVTLMLANNESGAIMEVAELGRKVRQLNLRRQMEQQQRSCAVFLHTDAAQAIGKIRVNVRDLNVDYLTIVGHKFYGPRIGALYHRSSSSSSSSDSSPAAPVHALFLGGGQEGGVRAGTENTPMIVGLGEAARLVRQHLERDQKYYQEMRTYLAEKLQSSCLPFSDNFSHLGPSARLPNTLSARLASGCPGGSKALLAACHGRVEASTAAACHSGAGGAAASAVLCLSGVSAEAAAQTIRLSVGRGTNKRALDNAVQALAEAYQDLAKR